MSDLIEVAELDTGKRELKLEQLRPAAGAARGARPLLRRGRGEAHPLEVSAYADLALVKADRRALRSILDNLLSNALRYTPPDGEILLAAEEIKDFVQFTVRDTGRGIEAERLSIDLRPLQRVLRERNGHGAGAGAAAGGVAGRPDCRGEPAGPRNDVPLYASRGGGGGGPPSGRGGLSHGRDHARNSKPEPAKLRIYIGAAPGVGKTYHMLNDAHLMRHSRTWMW